MQAPPTPSQHLQTTPRVAKIFEYPAIHTHTKEQEAHTKEEKKISAIIIYILYHKNKTDPVEEMVTNSENF